MINLPTKKGDLYGMAPLIRMLRNSLNHTPKNISRPDSEAILRGLAMRTTAEWLTAYSQTLASETWGNRECNTHASKQALSKKEPVPLSIIFPQFKTLVSRMLKIKWSDKFNTFALLAQAPNLLLLLSLLSLAILRSNHTHWIPTTTKVLQKDLPPHHS